MGCQMADKTTDLHRIQSERVKRMLSDLGISQSELARQIGCSTAAVNQWVTGKRGMRMDSAQLIEDRYPLYSAEWLTGQTDHQNLARVFAATLKDMAVDPMVAATITLASGAGYDLLTPFDTATRISDSAQALYDGHDMLVTIGGTDQTLTLGQLVELTGELTDYLTVRLRRMSPALCAQHD